MTKLWGHFKFRVGVWALVGVFLFVISLDIMTAGFRTGQLIVT